MKAKLCKFRLEANLIDKWDVGNRKPGEEARGKKHGFGGTMAQDSSQSKKFVLEEALNCKVC